MSGLAALIRFDGGEAGLMAVQAMTAAMAFRGPDGITHWADGSASLGYCAMHASEADSPAQPLASEDGQVLAVFDGFLANHDELRADLLARGARLRWASDAELVLSAYEAWGEDFAAHLDGEFAVILWDRRTRTAVCARDHHGLRPLYWHWDGHTLVAASEIAAVLAALRKTPELNLGYLAEIAADVFYSPDETVWQGVARLLPAHVLRVDAGGPRLSEYWSLPTEVDILYARDEDYAEHYREVLTQSVRRAARSHLPLACEVSGGLDSSSVYCLAHQLQLHGRLPAPALRGYTLAGPPGSAADEVDFARMVGTHTGTAIAEQQLFLPPLEWFARQSATDRDLPPLPNAAMTITLDEAAVADGSRVSLGGIGGDQWCDGTHFYYGELFAARRWGQLLNCYRADIKAGGFVAASGLLARLGPGSLLPPRWRQTLRKALGGRRVEPAPTYLQPQFQRELAERQARYEAGYSQDYRASYKLRKLRHPSWTVVLDQLSRQRANSGLELRSPMLSRSFIEFSARTPEHLKLRGGTSKYLHRTALAGILPSGVVQRQSKAEFSAAYTNLVPALQTACSKAEVPAETLFDAGKITSLFGTYHRSSIDERSHGAIWGVYVAMLMVKRPADI